MIFSGRPPSFTRIKKKWCICLSIEGGDHQFSSLVLQSNHLLMAIAQSYSQPSKFCLPTSDHSPLSNGLVLGLLLFSFFFSFHPSRCFRCALSMKRTASTSKRVLAVSRKPRSRFWHSCTVKRMKSRDTRNQMNSFINAEQSMRTLPRSFDGRTQRSKWRIRAI